MRTRVKHDKNSGQGSVKIAELEGSAIWTFEGWCNQREHRDLDGNSTWVGSLYDKTIETFEIDLTDSNRRAAEQLKEHDRLTPIHFEIDGKSQDTCYLRQVQIDNSARKITCVISNLWQ